MSSTKPIFVEHITEAKTYPAIIGRIVRCSPHVTVTDSGLSHWNFTLRGHDMSFISASAFNLPKRFPSVAALEGKVVLVLKLQVVSNKKDYLRFGSLGARFKDVTTITLLPEDATLPSDVPPLLTTGDDIEVKDLKRDRSTSSTAIAASQVRHACPMNCRYPDSYVCGKTGEPHVISVCEFCNEPYDGDEPFCRVRRGHRHTANEPSTMRSPAPVRAPTPSSAEDMVPVTY